MKQSARVEQEAAAWLVSEDRGLGMREKAAFEAWLQTSPIHRVTYLRLKAAWRSADHLASRKGMLPRPRRSLGTYVWPIPARPALAAAALLLICGIGGHYLSKPARQFFVTQQDERRIVSLADGTRIEMDANTRIETDESGSSRRVALDYGQAYFDVIHEPKRPFVVVVGDRKITDIGTKFALLRSGDTVTLLVAEGEVRIDLPGTPPSFVHHNMLAVSQGHAIMLAAKQPGEVADALAWREGLVKFSDLPLEDVVKEFNRYNKRQIRVDASARDITVGGSFRADNPERFEAILKQIYGVKVEERGGETHISR